MSIKEWTVIPIIIFWFTTFILITLFVWDRRSSHYAAVPGASDVDESVVPDRSRQKIVVEPLEEFLERTDTCNSLMESGSSTFNVSMLNETVLTFCRELLKTRSEYYRLRSDPVSRFTNTLLIRGEKICDNTTQMIIIVHSLHTHRDRRHAIRNTWGGAATTRRWPHIDSSLLPNVRVAFIFGVHPEQDEEESLQLEDDTFHDVIQGDFVESYKNMTLKSLLGLHWAVDHCSAAKYLFKCDDDMIINVPAVWQTLESANMTWSIMGPLNLGSRVYRRGAKWRLTKKEYPFAFFPPYESGSGYAISADLWRPLVNAADYVPRIFIDDVYITGILGKILDVRHVKRDGFAYWTDKRPSSCAVLNGTVLTGTRVDTSLKQYHIWEEISTRVGCPLSNTSSSSTYKSF